MHYLLKMGIAGLSLGTVVSLGLFNNIDAYKTTRSKLDEGFSKTQIEQLVKDEFRTDFRGRIMHVSSFPGRYYAYQSHRKQRQK